MLSWWAPRNISAAKLGWFEDVRNIFQCKKRRLLVWLLDNNVLLDGHYLHKRPLLHFLSTCNEVKILQTWGWSWKLCKYDAHHKNFANLMLIMKTLQILCWSWKLFKSDAAHENFANLILIMIILQIWCWNMMLIMKKLQISWGSWNFCKYDAEYKNLQKWS